VAYKLLYLAGRRNMLILDEGLPGWADKGYPLDKSTRRG
jgi:3-mercaptopyruvate sulfurtransferase SseA